MSTGRLRAAVRKTFLSSFSPILSVLKRQGISIRSSTFMTSIRMTVLQISSLRAEQERSLFGEHNCKVFPVAHCGVLGTNNRNRNRNYDEKLDIQKNDWSKIKRELQI